MSSDPGGNHVPPGAEREGGHLAGTNGVMVIVRGSDAHTAYAGLRDVKTMFTGLLDVRVIEDFEGQVSLGLGVSGKACYRASFLANPVRLVIDIQNS